MRALLPLVTALLLCVCSALPAAAEGKVAIVAAESVYGDVAQQIGGDRVAVTSLITNPAQDPHLFEASPTAARAIADAQIVVANGADYDAWLDKFIRAAPRQGRTEIVIAKLIGRKAGDNPHLWYDPAAMPAFAKALAAALSEADPAHKADYEARLAAFQTSLQPIADRIAAMRGKYQGAAVTATEPVFELLTDAIGLINRNRRFQLAMMNETEPSAKDIAAFESDLKQRKVKALIVNAQVSEALAKRMERIAIAAKVPVMRVTETLPPGMRFQEWLTSELDALAKALDGAQ